MIIRKSPAELDKMRRAGAITAATIDRVLEAVAVGATTLDLDRVAEEFIRAQGATPSFLGYKGFTASICASINEEIVHGIPAADRVLADGDLLSLDFGAIWEGFHSDAAVTVFVGAPPSDDAKRLAATTEAALDAAISVIRPGGRLSDIGHAIEQAAIAQGLGVIREYGGHGIGRALH
jgi:methionyl aminopeptidase